MVTKICRHCEEEFDIHSAEKRKAGGYIDECPWCLEELGGDQSEPAYLGVSAGEGKMGSLTILRFPDEKSRETYHNSWKNNAGSNKGKSCQLGRHLTSMSGMRFEIVGENRANANHKGKE